MSATETKERTRTPHASANKALSYCRALNGHLLAFAFFDDGIELEEAHTLQDALVEAVAGY